MSTNKPYHQLISKYNVEHCPSKLTEFVLKLDEEGLGIWDGNNLEDIKDVHPELYKDLKKFLELREELENYLSMYYSYQELLKNPEY